MMSSIDANFASKRVNDASKKSSPLKVVSPIIKKYSGQRLKKLEFPRRRTGGKSRNKNQAKPALKNILPKTNAGDVIILESELLPCALNIQSIQRKIKREETENKVFPKSPFFTDENFLRSSPMKENCAKPPKSKIGSVSKRRKYLKNIEATFTLLKPESEGLKEKREQAFVENYLQRVQRKLKGKNDALYNHFVDLICDFKKRGMSVIDLYKRIRLEFRDHVDLGEDFVAFLTPEQAVECGVFMEHHLLMTVTDFLNMMDIYFSKSSQQAKKIHSILEGTSSRRNATTEEVKSAVFPLLKGNTVLHDYFGRLLPLGSPPPNFLMDFEEYEHPELNSDASEDEDHYEKVKVPEIEEAFSGDSCACNCHNTEEEKLKTRADHCISCSVKYINGKIFIQQGKLLRPARVSFEDHDVAYHRDRLAPKLYPKRGSKKCRGNMLKETLSPTKSCYLSSDEFKSDIEDEEKIKTKLGLCKSPRTANKKMASPKNCDRSVVRAIFNDGKSDGVETEAGKCAFELKDEKLCKDSGSNAQSDVCDVAAGAEVPTKPLDLPRIDEEEPEEPEMMRSPIAIDKDGSRSPPVISIPDSTNPPLFPSGKPILSFLENIADSKEPVLLISDSSDKVIGFEPCTETPFEDCQVHSEEDGAMAGEVGEEEKSRSGDEGKVESPWKIEEDRIILQTLQVEENCEETFRKINDKIPSRSLEDIKKRFATLMTMLYEMKAKTAKKEEGIMEG